MIHVLLLASLSWGQLIQSTGPSTAMPFSGVSASTDSSNLIGLQDLRVRVRGLVSGRSTVTGFPTYLNGFTSSGPVTNSGTLVQSGAATLSGPVTISGQRTIFLSSAAPSAASTIDLNLPFTSTGTYECWFNLAWNTTTGSLQARMNGDSGSNYMYAINALTTGGTGGGASNGTTAWLLSFDTIKVTAAGVAPANGQIKLFFTGGQALGSTWQSGFTNNINPAFETNNASGFWNSTATPTKITFFASAGTFTGFIECSGYK